MTSPRDSLVVLLCLLSVAGACGGGDEEAIEQTLRDFVSATNEQDADAFCGEIVTQ